jgi:hypothetical protein
MQFTNFWTLGISAEPYWIKWVENRETQDGARTQRPPGGLLVGSLSTNPNKSVVFSTSFDAFTTHSQGKTVGADASGELLMKPTTTLELDVATSYSIFNNNPRAIGISDNGDGTRTYLFQELDYQSVNLTVRGTYTLSTKVSLQAYAQTLLDHGIFNHSSQAIAGGRDPLLRLEDRMPSSLPSIGGFRDGTVNVNVFLRWQYLPGSAIWFVYTHSQLQTPFDAMMESSPKFRIDRFSGGEATDVVLAKLTYLWY